MKSAARVIGTSCLFVGSVVGAGFATGREISLFFGGGSVLNLVIAAACMGAMAFVFTTLGARGAISDPRLRTAAETLVAVCSFAVYAAMIASAESILFDSFAVRGLSLFVAAVCLLISFLRIRWVSCLNLIAVPVLIFLIALVGVPCVGTIKSGALFPIRSLGYGAMNLLFSGALLYKEGETLTKKERLGTAVLSGAVLFFLMLCLFAAMGENGGAEMPFCEAAKRAGLGKIVAPVLLLAVLTTMAGCEYLLSERLFSLTKDRVLSSLLPVFCGIPISLFGFSRLVGATYPLISVLGLLVSAVAVSAFIFQRKKAKS